jgi:FixJ family two-component response regulator
MNTKSTIFIVDDDHAVLQALGHLLRASGFMVHTFTSSLEFLKLHDAAVHGCVLLDIAMPGMNGLDLQKALAGSGATHPVIFLTGQGDIPASVQAMKAGAVDFLTKPVERDKLLAAIGAALEKDDAARAISHEQELMHQKMAALTPREHEVLVHVVTGSLNKQIAAKLGTAERTIKFHRAHLMQKLGVQNVAELVRITERSGLLASPV